MPLWTNTSILLSLPPPPPPSPRRSLPSEDIILGPGMRFCRYQPTYGAYLHLVTEPTEPYSRQLPNCGTVFRRRSETFRDISFKRALKTYFFMRAFNWLILILSCVMRIWQYFFCVCAIKVSYLLSFVRCQHLERLRNRSTACAMEWPPHSS